MSKFRALVGTVLLVFGSCWFGEKESAGSDPGEFPRLMNLGKAYLENRDSAKAIEALTNAVALVPTSAPAWRNLGRAHQLARQPKEAINAFGRAREIEPDQAAAFYLEGLAKARQSRFGEAIGDLETAARLDPRTPAIRYQLALAYAAENRHDQAAEQLRETLRLDPLHGGAHFRLSAYARDGGDEAKAQEHLREFTRIRQVFGDAARSTEALEACVYTQPEGLPAAVVEEKPSPPFGIRFENATAEPFVEDDARSLRALAVLEIDEQGRYRFVGVRDDGRLVLLADDHGRFVARSVDVRVEGRLEDLQAIVGDFHNRVPKNERYDPKVHARNDVLLVSGEGVWLFERVGDETFENVTERAGLKQTGARAARWFDYDHDGDVDLLFARQTGAEVWQNNGDGTFANVTQAVGIGGADAATDVAAADLDNDLAIDVVIARDNEPTQLFRNRRAGRFEREAEPPGPWPSARQVLLDDLDNDGFVDVVLLRGGRAELLTRQGVKRQVLDSRDVECTSAALVDVDNDSWLDLLIIGAGREECPDGGVVLWHNYRGVGWQDVTEDCGLSRIRVSRAHEVIAADVDGDGDTDVLIVGGGGVRFLRNIGGDANGQLKLRLRGTKTNPLGIGTHLEVRSGDLWLTRAVSAIPTEIGLGGRKQLDSVQTIWTNGVVDNQIDVPITGRPLTVLERNVATGSCPFLYVWDGRRFRFVTDILGNSPLGLSLRRGQVLPADPDEWVAIGEQDTFIPRSGRYEVEITSEFREVLYLDHARLAAVDLREGIEVHPTDRLGPPPFPPSDLWPLRLANPLRSAIGDDGVDRTQALQRIDGSLASCGVALPPPYRGVTEPLALTLDFGALDAGKPLVLVLTGWLQYGDASTNIALSQDERVRVIPPTLSAEVDEGRWVPLDVVVGMPAGKTKTILCDLSRLLPAGARQLRLTTSFEIRWDRIALMERVEVSAMQTHIVEPATAALRWRGFSELKSRAPNHPTTPDYDRVAQTPPWRTTIEGWCTRYGDVLELVRERDDRIVVVNAGDAVSVTFDASALPATTAGHTRSFFLYSVGWDKDADLNVVDGDTVGPLPVRLPSGAIDGSASESDWWHRFNTRWVPRDAPNPGRDSQPPALSPHQ